MKTFKDLEFENHHSGSGLQAVMEFPNRYGISVVKFRGSYGYRERLWEAAVFYEGKITYDTELTDDVLGYQTEENITELMKQIQSL